MRIVERSDSMNTVCSEPRYGEIKIARAELVEASMRRSNMSQPSSNDSDQDDFNVISAQYKLCLEKTSMDIGKSWFRYMGKETAPKEKRRRYVLQTLLGSVQAWRYMADCSEVVLGSWEMIDHDQVV